MKLYWGIVVSVWVTLLISGAQAFATPLRVGVIDTGVDINHPELQSYIEVNQKEIPNNGIDDDGNGYVDDTHGWNAADNNSRVGDSNGHGTHIAGIVVGGLKRLSFVEPIKIIPIKYFKKGMKGRQLVEAFNRAIDYAIEREVDVLQISGGGRRSNPFEYEALLKASQKGIIVVAAAGNKKPWQKNFNFYPAAYPLSNVLSVIATNRDGEVLPTSNVNPVSNNILFPGRNIFSTLPNGRYGLRTGSSQAAALVTSYLIKKFLSNKDKFSSFSELVQSNNLDAYVLKNSHY